MNIRTNYLLIAVLTVSLSQGCDLSSSRQKSIPETTGRNNGGSGTEAYTNEAEEYESDDRVIWQKPDLVIDQLGNVDGKVVADLGAGTGYFSRRIAYKGARVIAIDIDPRAIQWMEDQKARFPSELQNRLVIRQAEPADPKLSPKEVDIVLLVNTYSYIDDRVAYFSRLKSAFRPEGQIIIIDFKKRDTPFGPPVEERIDVATIEAELRAAGYTILKVDEESLDYQYILKASIEE